MPTNVLAADGTRVARCDFDGDFDHPECAANARLFSAAHELLAACIEVESETPAEDFERLSENGIYVFMTWECVDALRQAIAKAGASS